MFPEIWIFVFGNFDLWSLASHFSFVPGRSPEPKVQIFRLWKSKFPDGKVHINIRVPGTYEQLPRDFSEHPHVCIYLCIVILSSIDSCIFTLRGAANITNRISLVFSPVKA